ncbi:MAG: FtsX-like permease family protein [Flavobacteriales bacterium]
MKTALFIARRYFFSRKKHNVINVISAISVVGVSVGTFALIVLLSAFNGLESWVVSLYDAFDSDFKIEAENRKFFATSEIDLNALKNINGIAFITPVIEENGLVRYRDRQHLVTFKGVGNDYNLHTGIDSMIISGSFDLQYGNSPAAVVGAGVAYILSLSTNDSFNPMELYVPRKNAGNTLNPEDAFNNAVLFASGIFQIQPEFDNKYVILPIDFAAPLFERESELSSVEIGLKKGFKSRQIKQKLENVLGPAFVVKNRFEQHQLLYKIINAEKWAVYLILTFILIIATFNIIGSLTMLVVEKSDDIRVLSNLGASPGLLRRIFFFEGMLISYSGCIIGLVLGFVAIFLQKQYGLIMIVEDMPYPMLIKWEDVLFVVITVLSIGAISAWFPAGKSVNKALMK